MPKDWETTLPVAAPYRSGMEGLRLVIVGNENAATHQLPTSGTVSIGRSEEASICLLDPAISRRHALLHVGPRLTLEDLGSANGTYVRGVRVGSGQTVEIEAGDVVEIGTTLLIVQGRSRPRGAAGIVPMPGERPMEAINRLIDRIARSNLSVLLLGETGVGKGFIAAELHRRSNRSEGPMVELNCAAFPENLLESELFGYEKGAFTGATQAKRGLLESASGGTVLLDEIGELPIGMQPKLLRVLEEREVMPVGGLRARAVDVRFISATNRDLEGEVAQGKFREDLYFRLNGISVEIPALRKRISEIPGLATSFALEASRRFGFPSRTLSPEAIELLMQYRWPGNIRELRNVVERAFALCSGPCIEAKDIPIAKVALAKAPPALAEDAPGTDDAERGSEHPERRRILAALDQCGWNQSRAAIALGISRQTLSTRLDAYNIPRPRKGRKSG
ncbi:MAG TPA: sigma 54-interacting transcriptional regulator [Myxococcaceae bacterium]|nr:sigma 54-interacting transcriptional regulator [Myxococcaceae bacterium]